MAITNTPLLGLPYAGADTDETYAVLARLFVKDGQKLTLPEIVEKYTPTIGTVYIKAADWTAADGTADAYDAKITISGVESDSMILIYPYTDGDAEKASRLGIRAKAASGVANDDTFVIVRATGGDPTVTEGINLVYIALRGYPVWSEGLTPPALPYATVIGVDPYIATEEGDRDDIAASQRLVTEAVTALRSSLSTLTTGLSDTNKAVELRLKSADLPSKLDEYRAAKGLIDKTVNDLVNYYTKSQTLTKDEINALVSAIPKFKIEVVTSLPTSNISDTTVYLVKSGDDDTNLYTEFIRTGGKWEKLGTQTVDLTGYATEAWVNDILASYVKTVDMEAYVAGLLEAYITKNVADETYQPIGNYPTTAEMDEAISNATENLAPKSSIPTKVSQLSNDSGYLTPTTGDQRYAKPSDIPTVPQTLPNPYALNLLGKTYNGSSAVSLTVDELIEAIKTASGGVIAWIGDDNNIYLAGNLSDGTYKAYFAVEGEYIEIGELTKGEEETPEPVTYTVTFVADGVTVDTVEYQEGDTALERVPDVPAKEGYTGVWEDYDITNGGNITVNAVYTAIEVEPAEPTNFFKATPTVSTPSAASQDAVVLGGRLGGDLTYRADGGPDCLLTNYIPVQSGDVVEMTNLAFNSLNSAMYKADKTIIGAFQSTGTAYVTNVSTSGNKQTFTVAHANAGYVRVSGKPDNGIKINQSGADVSLRYDLTQIVIKVKRNGTWL